MINCVRFLDSNCIGSCAEDATINIYDIRSNKLVQHYEAHSGIVN
jgi:hypothetical protein